ncbi:jg15431 [Pararge aegeria aegeria]|uniref:Jg15431 protein n=1 Tax=Pararge aegeria aegeria TaxID=348720 RepID=A0A8S4S5N4_9NEOP|nr:jg15431 [Pararge aegeria aegeria]
MPEGRLLWYGHIMRRDKSHMTQRAIDEGKRGRGRPLTTWTRTVFSDIKTLGLTPEMTQDRIKWRTSIRRADPKEGKRQENDDDTCLIVYDFSDKKELLKSVLI